MNVFPREDKQAIVVTDFKLNPDGSMPLQEAHKLYDGIFNALRECGVQITLTVEVKGPTNTQLQTAVTRVGHLRRQYRDAGWSDDFVNRTLVEHVLKACL